MGKLFSNTGIEIIPATSWDVYFDDICCAVAKKSKDPNTKLGCVIVNPQKSIITTGFNGFCRNVREDIPERWSVRATKYFYVEHAERNAIYNAARNGAQGLFGSSAYIPVFPCNECAKALIQVGVSDIRMNYDKIKQRESELNQRLTPAEYAKYLDERDMVADHLKEAGIRVVIYEMSN